MFAGQSGWVMSRSEVSPSSLRTFTLGLNQGSGGFSNQPNAESSSLLTPVRPPAPGAQPYTLLFVLLHPAGGQHVNGGPETGRPEWDLFTWFPRVFGGQRRNAPANRPPKGLLTTSNDEEAKLATLSLFLGALHSVVSQGVGVWRLRKTCTCFCVLLSCAPVCMLPACGSTPARLEWDCVLSLV